MRTFVVVPPAEDAVVTLQKAKQHLKVQHAAEDDLIAGYIAAAVGQVDVTSGWFGRAMGRQTIEARVDNFGCGSIVLPFPPIRAIVSAKYIDQGGVEQTIDPADYELLGSSLVPAFGKSWPSIRWQREAIRIRYEAGHDAELPVPAPIVTAVLLMIGDLYRHRDTTANGQVVAVPMSTTVDALLSPLRVYA